MSDTSAPEMQIDPLNASLGKTQEMVRRPPKLSVGITHSEGSQQPPDSVSEVAPRWTRWIGVLDSAIKSQTPDPMWANDMMSAIRAAYAGLAGVSIDSIECGQTLCRLELLQNATDDSGPLQAKTGLARMAIATGEQAFGVAEPPTPPKLVIYMSRENMRLPNRFE